MLIDLHCHSTASDGSLSPQQLVTLAVERGIALLSITDHDSVAAYRELGDISELQLLPGLELSCRWAKDEIHVLGLGIDPDFRPLLSLLEAQAAARHQRAERIAHRLSGRGLPDVLPQVKEMAAGRAPNRPDFAKALVAAGAVKDEATAFKRWLGKGKVGDVHTDWVGMQEGIRIIKAAGGVAVLAHPKHYNMTNSKLRRLLADFQSEGGEGLEVWNGKPGSDELNYLRRLCREFAFEASIGSDFHAPGQWLSLGCQPVHHGSCEPVWQRWLAH